jgi:peroxiredoxin
MNGLPRCARFVACFAAAVIVASVAFAEPPNLTLTDPVTGKPATVAPAPGVSHIVFFATWCPECVQELPDLADLEVRWSERDYRLVLIAVNTRQSTARLAKFAQSKQPPGRLLFDEHGHSARSMNVTDLPTHILLGPDGTELERGSDIADIRAKLERRLRSEAPSKR